MIAYESDAFIQSNILNNYILILSARYTLCRSYGRGDFSCEDLFPQLRIIISVIAKLWRSYEW